MDENRDGLGILYLLSLCTHTTCSIKCFFEFRKWVFILSSESIGMGIEIRKIYTFVGVFCAFRLWKKPSCGSYLSGFSNQGRLSGPFLVCGSCFVSQTRSHLMEMCVDLFLGTLKTYMYASWVHVLSRRQPSPRTVSSFSWIMVYTSTVANFLWLV